MCSAIIGSVWSCPACHGPHSSTNYAEPVEAYTAYLCAMGKMTIIFNEHKV